MPTLEAIAPIGTYTLSDGAPFAVISTEEGGPPIRRITDRGPLQDGDSDLDFRLEPLTWPLGLRIYAADAAAQYDSRTTLRRIFRPSRVPIKMRWTLENGDVRQIDCHVSGKLAFASGQQDGFSQRCVVPLRAADPTWYDPTIQATTFGVGGGTSAFTVPVAVPVGVGAATVDQTRAIAYAGTWRSYPIIQVTGPINSLVITNNTTGDKLDFTGYNISAGAGITIDCRPGVKTIIDTASANVIDKLSDDSDLATFALEADADAPGGVNSIRVTGSSATSATEIYFSYYNRYEGV